jgi:hypothetical protein
MKNTKARSPKVINKNLAIDINNPDYKSMKKQYNNKDFPRLLRERIDFFDNIISGVAGKYKLNSTFTNLLPKQKLETIVIIGKNQKKDFVLNKLVLCRFLYQGPNTYEVVRVVNEDDVKLNKNGFLILKQKS